jgi:hypothetical protein
MASPAWELRKTVNALPISSDGAAESALRFYTMPLRRHRRGNGYAATLQALQSWHFLRLIPGLGVTGNHASQRRLRL